MAFLRVLSKIRCRAREDDEFADQIEVMKEIQDLNKTKDEEQENQQSSNTQTHPGEKDPSLVKKKLFLTKTKKYIF
jgi:hypothetical protein